MNRIIIALALGFCTSTIFAQDRIDRALGLSKRTANLVDREQVKPNWLPDGKSFWYRVQTGSQSHEFVLINGETGERKAARDLETLALPAGEKKSSKQKIELRPSSPAGVSSGLKFVNKLTGAIEIFWINEQGKRIGYGEVASGAEREQHSYAGHVWLVTNKAGETLAVVDVTPTVETLIIDGKGIAAERSRRNPGRNIGRGTSPDEKFLVLIENGSLKLKNRENNEVMALKAELPSGSSFRESVFWAPDSSAFVAVRVKDVPRRKITIVDSSPKDVLQPKLKELDYNKPGDPLPEPVAVLFRIGEGGAGEMIESPLLKNPFNSQLDIKWAADSSEFYFDHNQRGHQAYRIVAVNAKTAEVRAVVDESSQTFIDYTNKTWRKWLPDTNELLWMSERDGWCHLWLYDVKTGELKNQVTKGNWPVRQVLHVDEAAREVWFMASGVRPDEDPYYQHLCRVKFDGSEFRQLTEGNGQHRIEFSPNRRVFLDTWSRVDQPPLHELRNSSDGSLICVCEKSNADRLLAAGWTMPERFVAKAREGKTDIHGIIIKPSHFDPQKKYPVVEEIYAGPQSAFVPKEFGRQVRQHSIAELGFIVVQIDGMGTNHRGKAFHDVCWKNLKDAGFADRIAWIKSAAESRPWMNLQRVGIYGGSAGGQNAMRALLDHHDFYKVAVADCGCHDNRMDKLWWNEQWMGWPIDDSYARSSNKEDAHKLQGKLLLIVGELDTNVDPASTTQVVGALQKAGKSFDFVPIIGAGHGAAETPYGSRLRMEFLIKHLQP
ncbi:prolyl oligopeptidase family serine peptidase [Anatilimnocola sp. NA78]|uniref:prolyl oligopeptidase family serine peptidase n=1 Tax=Anatilimnocola sp. NA78 TaxID=3415683 RepID=UPI003CE52689